MYICVCRDCPRPTGSEEQWRLYRQLQGVMATRGLRCGAVPTHLDAHRWRRQRGGVCVFLCVMLFYRADVKHQPYHLTTLMKGVTKIKTDPFYCLSLLSLLLIFDKNRATVLSQVWQTGIWWFNSENKVISVSILPVSLMSLSLGDNLRDANPQTRHLLSVSSPVGLSAVWGFSV